MELSERIVSYITNHHPIAYTTLVNVAKGKGFSEYEVVEALAKVHKNKSITTKNRKEEIWYDILIFKPIVAPTHTLWLAKNYPWPEHFEMPFPEIDYSHIFMTPDEAKAYKAEAKGMPLYMMSKYEKK